MASQNTTLLALTCLIPIAGSMISARAAESEADKAWAETEQAFKPPTPPAAWQETRPSREEIEAFREKQGKLAEVAAKRAREFYEKYPDHEKAAEAREKEVEMLTFAVQLGNESASARLGELEEAKLADPNLSDKERFELRAKAVQRAAMEKVSEGREAAMAEYERGARTLMKEFPQQDGGYQMLLSVARNGDADKATAVAKEVLESPASDRVKSSAREMLKKFEALGKPLDIEFTAIDGREISIKGLKGKVVLVDFWATWCGPCVAELPNVKRAYAQLHPKGFEIVGISFDKDKEKLESFVKKEEMTWPQYFDGKGWDNELGRRFGIRAIPSMWLVNKEGLLVDMNGREGLEKKVEKLLAE